MRMVILLRTLLFIQGQVSDVGCGLRGLSHRVRFGRDGYELSSTLLPWIATSMITGHL
jgi:hypothetical protein